jgi:hypothetical protein
MKTTRLMVFKHYNYNVEAIFYIKGSMNCHIARFNAAVVPR